MNLKKIFLVGLLCAFLAPTNVFAEKGKWSFTPYLGANVATSRDMSKSQTSTAGSQTFSDGSQFDGTLVVSTRNLSFDDTHDARILTGFDVGYALTNTWEVFGGFQYVTASGNKTGALDVTAAGTFTNSAGTATALAIGATADAEADDYNSWAIKVGATKYFPMGDYTPYVGGYGGFKHVDEMDVTLTHSTAGAGSLKINFYDSTNTGFFGFHTGVNRGFSMGGTPLVLGVRARLDYTPELNDDDTDLGGSFGVDGSNNAGGGVDFGLTAQLSIPF
jgi:hypothetical protein